MERGLGRGLRILIGMSSTTGSGAARHTSARSGAIGVEGWLFGSKGSGQAIFSPVSTRSRTVLATATRAESITHATAPRSATGLPRSPVRRFPWTSTPSPDARRTVDRLSAVPELNEVQTRASPTGERATLSAARFALHLLLKATLPTPDDCHQYDEVKGKRAAGEAIRGRGRRGSFWFPCN
jgi:hypothetical protein